MLLLEWTVSFKEQLVCLLFPWNQLTDNQNIYIFIVILDMKEQHVIETLHSKK